MAQYKIERLSSKPPREWSFEDKKTGADVHMVTYKVMLTGEGEPVEINKKPTSDAPKVGEVLDGTIEKNEYGSKFKAAPKPYGGGGQGSSYTPRDDASIKAQFAIKAAIQFVSGTTTIPCTPDEVEKLAKEFYAMVDRIKGGTTAEPQAATPVKKLDEVVEVEGDEEIDLSTIPF